MLHVMLSMLRPSATLVTIAAAQFAGNWTRVQFLAPNYSHVTQTRWRTRWKWRQRQRAQKALKTRQWKLIYHRKKRRQLKDHLVQVLPLENSLKASNSHGKSAGNCSRKSNLKISLSSGLIRQVHV